MRACGNCGESGHNRRTCKKAAVTTPAAPAPVTAVIEKGARDEPNEPKSNRTKGIGDDLDEETKEAIDWYLEQRYPGYLKRRKTRESRVPDDGEEE